MTRQSHAPGRGLDRVAALTALSIILGVLAPDAAAEMRLRWRGSIMADTRLTLQDKPSYERIEGTAYARLDARLSKHVAATADLRVIFTEFGTPRTFSGLTSRLEIDPMRIESDNLFIEFRNMGLEGLDLRVGRQQLIWGSADRFHAVGQLNALDLEDPLKFGEVMATEMFVLSYRPDWAVGDEEEEEYWFDDFAIELAWVPIFRPAQLPRSGGLAFTKQTEFSVRATTPLLKQLVDTQIELQGANPPWTFDYVVEVEQPDIALENSMFGTRVSFSLFDIDLGLSYFRGFDDLPRAEGIRAVVSEGPRADAVVTLSYPRVHIVGLDFATSLDFLGGLGFWGELSLTIHDNLYRTVITNEVGINEAEIEFERGVFPKAVVGMDYSFTSWWYMNVQYVYGFVDEFGKRGQEHYIVGGMDFKVGQDVALIRMFTNVNLNDGSFALFPQLTLTPWSGGEITLGALLYSRLFKSVGDKDPDKRFETEAVGSSFVFLQTKASF